jgi:hypothetical protein
LQLTRFCISICLSFGSKGGFIAASVLLYISYCFASGTTATGVLQQLVLVVFTLASAIAFALAAASAAIFLFNRFSSNNALALAAFSNLVCASASAVAFASAIVFL